MGRRRSEAVLLAGAALAGGLSWWTVAPPPEAVVAAATPPRGLWAWGDVAPQDLAPRPGTLAPMERARQRLFVQGSLAGTEPAGDWCVGDAGLRPCAALRERFDHYLLGLGEVSPADLRALVQRDAAQAHGDFLAAQIIEVWDRYWTLRQQVPRVPFDARDRSSWTALLAEQRGVRRRLLGADWAQAFYADEEHDFEQLQRRLDAGAPTPPDPGAPVVTDTADRVERYGAAAAGRLAEVDAAWADWERRLAAAQGEWSRLAQAPELSDVARHEAMARYVDEHFRHDEGLRVRALLRL